jgi:hypothetical protein
MTLQSRFLFQSAHRPLLSLLLLAGLWTQTCRADLIVGNANPMDQTVSEHQLLGGVTFTVINTGLAVMITDYKEVASPRFGPADSGDIAYDVIQVFPPDRLATCNSGSEESLLIGKTLGFRESCSVRVSFLIVDNDPFDTFNPAPDFADWAVLLQVSAKDAFSGAPVPDEIGHAYVRVVDDVVPEPGTATLVSSGLFFVSLLYKRRKSRCPVR